jgi:predicted DNA-binding WGR domain protein
MSQTQTSALEEIFGYNELKCEESKINRRYEYKSHRRYYVILLTQDLFGEWSLMRVYGGINSNRGSSIITGFSEYAEAMKKIAEIGKRRLQHGYSLVQGSSD